MPRKMKPTYDELLEMLDNVSASAENMLLVLKMNPADWRRRNKIITEAREVCDRLLRAEESEETE